MLKCCAQVIELSFSKEQLRKFKAIENSSKKIQVELDKLGLYGVELDIRIKKMSVLSDSSFNV